MSLAIRARPRATKLAPTLGVGLGLVVAVVFLGVAVPLASPYSADQIIQGARLQPPSVAHPMGTDALGRDLLTRIAVGSHLAAQMVFLSVGLSLLAGLVLGSVAGFYGGWIDQVIARAMDGWLALPGALVAIVVVARLGPSLDNLIIALGLMGIPSFFRVVRGATLSARQAPFVEAAVALGAGDARLMWRHVFPNIASPIVVLTTLRLGSTLLTGSSLSFIGLGAQPPLPEWGALLATGRNYLDTAWWLAVFPGLTVTCTVIGLNLIGDGLRDVLDPQTTSASGQADATMDEPSPAMDDDVDSREPAHPRGDQGAVARSRTIIRRHPRHESALGTFAENHADTGNHAEDHIEQSGRR